MRFSSLQRGFVDGVGFTGRGHYGILTGAVMAISVVFGRKEGNQSARQ